MSAFRTILPDREFPFRITHEMRHLFLGSCFSDHIGQRFTYYQLPALVNPFGVSYNPYSIAKLLGLALSGYQFSEEELIYDQGLWFNFDFHHSFADPDRSMALNKVNKAIRRTSEWLKNTDVIWLTLGTAQVYQLVSSGQIVSNCHKVQASSFHKRMLSVSEAKECLEQVIHAISAACPHCHLVLTLSPIRHLRDGIVENQRSKARLLLAIEQIVSEIPAVCYFPAYELMMDDLRDYRFYASDFIHPSDQAIAYIWSYFSRHFFSEATLSLLREIEQINKDIAHRPFHPGSEAHQKFLRRIEEKKQKLKARYPFVTW